MLIDLGPGRVSNVVVRDVQLTGPTDASDTAVDGIAVESGNQILIERATITGPMGDGVDLKADNVTVRQVDARNYDRNGMKFWGASGTLVYFSRVTQLQANYNLDYAPDRTDAVLADQASRYAAPLFMDAGSGNYQLRSGSPGIDAVPTGQAPSVDLRGRARPRGSGADIGPYESG